MNSTSTKHSQKHLLLLSITLVVILCLLGISQSASLYDPVKSYVTIYNPKNFDS